VRFRCPENNDSRQKKHIFRRKELLLCKVTVLKRFWQTLLNHREIKSVNELMHLWD